MRFKKLRISVAISIVLFVLIVGTIITIGLIPTHEDEDRQLQLLPPTYTYSGKNTVQQIPSQNTAPQPSPAPTTIFHTRVVSGAS